MIISIQNKKESQTSIFTQKDKGKKTAGFLLKQDEALPVITIKMKYPEKMGGIDQSESSIPDCLIFNVHISDHYLY